MIHRAHILTLLLIPCIIALGCKPTPPPPATKPKSALVVFVGGLAMSQLGPAESFIAGSFPTIQHAHFQPEGWKGDVAGYCLASRYEKLTLVAHSFGCETICDAADKLPEVDLEVWIDPVCHTPFKRTLMRPGNVKRLIVFVRTNGELESVGIAVRATVVGADETLIIAGGHDDLPSNPIVLNKIRDEMAVAIGSK